MSKVLAFNSKGQAVDEFRFTYSEPATSVLEYLDEKPVKGEKVKVRYYFNVADIADATRVQFIAAMNNARAVEMGARWYADCRADLLRLSRQLNVSVYVAAGATAVLSSRMKWERNVPSAVRVIEALNLGLRGSELPAVASTFEPVRKIEKMFLSDGQFDTVLNLIVAVSKTVQGQTFKTRSFYLNLLGFEHAATVDVWMWRMMANEPNTDYRPSGWLYRYCADLIRSLASETEFTPAQVQAIIWCHVVDKPAEMRAE